MEALKAHSKLTQSSPKNLTLTDAKTFILWCYSSPTVEVKLSRHETMTSLVLFTVHMDNDSMVRISFVLRSKEEEEKGPGFSHCACA